MEETEEKAESQEEEQDVEELESVEVQRVRGVKNVARLKDLVALQQATYEQIKVLHKLSDEDVPYSPKLARSSSSKFMYPEATKLRNTQESFSSPRMRGAHHVANEISHEKARKDKFQRRRRQIVQDESKRLETLKRTHEAQDKRARVRQREMLQKQEEKTLAEQHRRLEQQKQLHEIQKIQEEAWERLKEHRSTGAAGKDTAQLESQATTSEQADTHPPSRPSTSPELGSTLSGVKSEPVFRDMLESHKLYDNTLSKWKVYVKENEQRAEAYWRKIVPSRCDRRKSSKNQHWRKAIQAVTTAHQFMSKTKDLQQGWTDEAPEPGSMWTIEGFSSASNSLVLNSHNSSMTVSPQAYAGRLERVKTHHLELNEKAHQKREQDEQFLLKKRTMSEGLKNEKVNRAKGYNDAWQQRNNDATQRRERLNNSNEDETHLKLEQFRQQRAETLADRDEELAEDSRDHEAYLSSVKQAGKMKHHHKINSFKDQQRNRDEQASGFLQNRQQKQKIHADSGITETVKQMRAKKAKSEQDFMRKTKEELEKKQKRNEQAKFLQQKPATPDQAFARYRYLRKANDSDRPCKSTFGLAELIPMPGFMMMPENDSLEKYASLDDLHAEDVDDAASPTGSPKSPEKSPLSGINSSRGTIHRAATSSSILQSPDTGRANVVFRRNTVCARTPLRHCISGLTAGGGGEEQGTEDAAGEEDSGDDDEASDDSAIEAGEREFLEDLQTRSAKWLAKLRKDSC